MAFNWRPRNNNSLYLPRQGEIKDAVNASYKSMFGSTQGIVGSSQFEAPKTSAFVQGGRAGIQGGDFLSEVVFPTPARTIEAPLRPLNVATGGAVGETLGAMWNIGKSVPILGQALGMVEGIGGILQASNVVARSVLNQGDAQLLVNTAHLRPTDMIPIGPANFGPFARGPETVGQFRERILNKWGVNEFTGEPMAYEQLLERARNNTFDFGEFKTDENGLVGFFKESVADPINIAAFVASGGTSSVIQAAKIGARQATAEIGVDAAMSAANLSRWTRPIVSLSSRATYLPRIGAGAMTRLRGAEFARVSFSRGTEFLERFGNVSMGPARLGNLADLAQKIYFPKYALLRAPRATQLTAAERMAGARAGLGLGRTKAAMAAWQLGGAMQMAATSGAEAALGVINQREYDEETGIVPEEQAGWLDDIQDILHNINNDHPLSDNQTFTMLALFSPWQDSLRVAHRRTGFSPEGYYNSGVKHTADRFAELRGQPFKSEADFLTQLGEGDIVEGRRRFEALANMVDIELVKNQVSDFTRETLSSIESKVLRAQFIERDIIESVINRRKTGALQGRSLADNIIRFYEEGMSPDAEMRLVRAGRTITWEGFVRNVAAIAKAQDHPVIQGLAHMGGLILTDGAPITKEIVQGMIGRLDKLDPDDIVPRDVASFIIEDHPALIYQSDFWKEFSFTLGQMLEKTGRHDRPLLPTEGVTVGQLRSILRELVDEAPSERELFHEPFLRLERRPLEPGTETHVLNTAIPEDTPHLLKTMAKRFVTEGQHALNYIDKITGIRNAEFYRNGKAKFSAAKELKGHFGNYFFREDRNKFTKVSPRIELDKFDNRGEGPQLVFPRGTPVDTRDIRLDFTDKDLLNHEYPAQEAYTATIGDKDVYIFRPKEGAGYIPNMSIEVPDNFEVVRESPELERTIADRGKIGRKHTIKNTDKWYVARMDGNGTLLTNEAFDTAKDAAEYVHFISDNNVSLTIEDGIITIDGKILPPVQQDIMAKGPARGFEFSEEGVLIEEIDNWEMTGRKEEPFTVVHDDSSVRLPGASRSDRIYYFIGEHGTPVGHMRLEFGRDGTVDSINTYVAPEYRGLKPYGRVMDRIYDQAFIDGIDLSRKSGTINTPAGRAATNRYWSTRRDTLDTEALDLAIQNGGRIMEVDILPEISLIEEPLRYTRFVNTQGTKEMEELFKDFIPEKYILNSYGTTDAGNPFVYITRQWEESMDPDDLSQVKSVEIDKDTDAATVREFDNMVEADKFFGSRTILHAGGNQHAETLSRWGFQEVATYGETTNPMVIDDIYDIDQNESKVYNTRGSSQKYYYHLRPATGFARVMKNGLEPGITREREAIGVYLASDVQEAHSLAPPIMRDRSMLFRVKKEDLTPASGRFSSEVVHEGKLSPDVLEYFGADGKWHPMTTAKAVFAYVGGDTTKAIINSRVDGANRPYVPSNRRTGPQNGGVERRLKHDATAEEMFSNEDTESMFYGENADRIWTVETDGHSDAYIFEDATTGKFRVYSAELELIGVDYPRFETFKEALDYFREYETVPGPKSNAGRNAALNIARKRANDASLMYPSLETLGPGYTNSRRFFSPAERRKHLNELQAQSQAKAASAAESMQNVTDTLELVSGLKNVTDIRSWWDKATPDEVRQLVRTVQELNTEFPSLSVADAGIYIDPRSERFGHLLTGYSSMARHVFDYGFLSPISRFYDSLFLPKHARALQREVLHELQVQTRLMGMDEKQTERFLEGVRQRVSESRSARGLGNIVGLHKARNIRALDESTLRVLITKAAGADTLEKINAHFGSVQKMVSEAANGLLRRSARRGRRGETVLVRTGRKGMSRLEQNANAALRHYQYDPVLEHVSDATHSMSKFWYPLFRFTADPLFAAMNLIEPYIYGISRNGADAMRHERSQFQSEINRRAVERSSRRSIPAGGFAESETLPIETLMTDAGMFTIPRNMRSSIEAEHEIGRMESYKNVLNDIPERDPLAQIFQERFGTMNRGEWAKEMDNVMYGWMNDGPEATVRQAFEEMREFYGWTDEEMTIVAPFVDRLAEMHRAQYNDLADLYIGRLNRTGIERTLDNFWLLWPLSYQIKATKWLASLMFQKIGGVKTGPLGAILYNEYRERFLRALENDADMQQWMEDNRDFVFLFEMMLPMSPESIGVSLNKAARISTSWLNAMTLKNDTIKDAIGDYSYVESVPELIEQTTRFGPVRTYNLFKRLLNEMQIPGWTYGNGSEGGSLDNYVPTR